MSSASKENLPIQHMRQTILQPEAILDDERDDDTERPVMLSPPPEEELRYRRMNNEPTSASKPLATSGRPNQLSELSQSPSNDLHTVKRKRALRSQETPPRPTRVSQDQQKKQLAHTPNPRLRKHVRHADLSPTTGAFADGSPPPAPGSGSPKPSAPSSSTRKSLLQETTDANMTSPTRKVKGKGRMMDLLTAIHSPHAANPTADYIPASRLAVKLDGNVSVRRRSVTPIPPYEPPAERFTPPREIMSTPVHAEKKPARRQTTTKKRVEPKAPIPMRIKTEPPEIDLTAPPPPASPSEDPILLVGSPPPPKTKRLSNLSIEASKAKDLVEFEMELDLPADETRINSAAAGPSAMSTPRVELSLADPIPSAFDFSNIDDDDNDGPSPFDFTPGAADDAWSDSDSDDDEVMEGEGDYTGKFLAFKIPLKMDPPTSATRHRMEDWGRPISPHPKKLALTDEEEDEDDIERAVDDKDIEEELAADDNESARQIRKEPEVDQIEAHEEQTVMEEVNDVQPNYRDRRGRRLTLSELEAKKFGSPKEGEQRETSPTALSDLRKDESEAYPGENVQGQQVGQTDENGSDTGEHSDVFIEQSMDVEDTVEHQSLEDISKGFGTEKNILGKEEKLHIRSGSTDTEIQDNAVDGPALSQAETLVIEPEQSFSRTLFSTEGPSAPFDSSPARGPSEDYQLTGDDQTAVGEEDPTTIQEQEGSSGSDSEEVTDLGVVKIVSNDPMAAARAAAILKMHDYDMIARKLRRKSMAGGGVRKSYGTPKKADLWRRRTIAGLSAEDSLNANITLPELLLKAEEELRNTPARSCAGSDSITCTPKKAVEEGDARQQEVWGPREWTKSDWKLLDSCFTDERYHLASSNGLPKGILASVDEVESQNVIQRFIMILGGAALAESHGPSWTTDKLLQRVQALRKRQRNGQGAPPTPVVASRQGLVASPSSSMIVPDFTPTPAERIRRFRYPGLANDASTTSTPNSSDRLFKAPLPPALSRTGTSSFTEALSRLKETSQEYDGSSISRSSTPSRAGSPEGTEDGDDVSQGSAASFALLSTPVRNHIQQQQQTPMSAVKRSLSYIGSFLRPGMFKSKEQGKTASRPGLPVPPADVLAKPRGPVATPSKKPAPKAAHPKEQVTLLPAPAPQPPSKIPRVAKRLVDLQHVPTPPPKPLVAKTISRRSSGSSVRDLVKEFEDMEKTKVKPVPSRVAELRKMGSLDSLKGRQGQKPTWKP